MIVIKTKMWKWWDIALLKWSAVLFGMVLGGMFDIVVKEYFWWFLIAAILFAIRPAIAYLED
jgi:hypothetical protein